MKKFKPALIGYIEDEKIELIPGKTYSILVKNLEFECLITGTFEKFTDSFIFLQTQTGVKLVNFDTIREIKER